MNVQQSLEAIASRREAVASRLEAVVVGWRPSGIFGWRPSQSLVGWRPSLLGWRWLEAIASRLDAVPTARKEASRIFAAATRGIQQGL